MRRAVPLALLVLLAGCAQPAEVAPASVAPTVEIMADRPDTSFGEVVTGPAAAPDENATTQAPPRLVPGEWWRIRFDSPFFEETPELVRVVAEAGPDGYVMGMPHEGWYKEAIAYHAPAFGDVRPDLSYDTHNERFEPLRFPLVAGATWTTRSGTADLVATVERADESTATIRFEPPPAEPEPTDPVYAAINPIGDASSVTLTYDARQHEVVRYGSALGTWEVVEHGYGFTGWVTVPRGIHTAIDHGQFLPATPGEPVVARTAQVEGGFNRLTLVQGIFALAPGAYRVRAVAPDGTEYLTESVGGQGFIMKFHEAADPDGAWALEDVVAGAGGTYSMGMAYHQYDIRLPDGAKRSDHSHEVVR